MECPKCSLSNPDTAIQCDCGHNFSTGNQDFVIQNSNPKPKLNILTLGATVAGTLLVIGLFDFMFGSSEKTPVSESPAKEIVYNSGWDASVHQVEKFLKANLNDPKSFEAIEWSPVTKVEGPLVAFTVRCKYRAMNAFGGFITKNQLFHLDAKGNVLEVKDF